MKFLLPYPHRELHPVARLRAWQRLSLALTLGILGAGSTYADVWETRLLAGWLTGSLMYLVLVWWGVGRLDTVQTRLRASSEDPGATALYVVLIAASWISLIGVLLVTDAAKASTGMVRGLHIGLALGALASTWLLIQTLFALRYARHYYRSHAGKDTGGLAFPGAAPRYADFAYFAAVIGMTSQVADVAITTTAMRRLVLVHGLVSFGFNLLVLALTINLVASALG
ncbi:MAG: DUF1345 domain-containing protein [Hyphomicrobiaceae bacterium]